MNTLIISRYGDDDEEPLEILTVEGRKRPRPSSNRNPPFNFDFDVINVEPTNKGPPFIFEEGNIKNKNRYDDDDDMTDENGLETMPFEIIEKNQRYVSFQN